MKFILKHNRTGQYFDGTGFNAATSADARPVNAESAAAAEKAASLFWAGRVTAEPFCVGRRLLICCRDCRVVGTTSFGGVQHYAIEFGEGASATSGWIPVALVDGGMTAEIKPQALTPCHTSLPHSGPHLPTT